mgnify:FL=1
MLNFLGVYGLIPIFHGNYYNLSKTNPKLPLIAFRAVAFRTRFFIGLDWPRSP